jgi:hypothetical protein
MHSHIIVSRALGMSVCLSLKHDPGWLWTQDFLPQLPECWVTGVHYHTWLRVWFCDSLSGRKLPWLESWDWRSYTIGEFPDILVSGYPYILILIFKYNAYYSVSKPKYQMDLRSNLVCDELICLILFIAYFQEM